MPFTAEEQARVADYLGFLDLSAAASIQLGFPAASQPLFLVRSALGRVLPEAENLVRKYLVELDRIDGEMSDARRRLKAKSIGNLTLNPDELRVLRQENKYWAQRLADILGVMLNPYSIRFGSGGGSGPNLRVVHD